MSTKQENKAKNILIIVPEYPPYNTGGGGLAYEAIARELSRRGSILRILTANHTSRSLNEEGIDEKRQEGLLTWLPLIPNYLHSPMLNTRMPLNRWSRKKIGEVLEENQWDYGLILGGIDFIGPYIARQLRKRGVRYVVDVHGYLDKPKYSLFVRKLFELFEHHINLPFLRGAAAVFTKSAHLIPTFNETAVIPNGIHPHDLTSFASSFDIRKKHGIPANNIIIFSLGRLQKIKGYQHVIEAVQNMNDVTYIVAGADDGYKRALMQISNPHVLILDHLDYETKKNYFKQCDIVAIPSHIESFGLVGLEAMAFGKAIIANPVGGLREYLQNGKNAILSSIDDPEQFKKDLLSLVQNKELRERLGRQALKDVEAYTWEHVVNQMEKEINLALSTK